MLPREQAFSKASPLRRFCTAEKLREPSHCLNTERASEPFARQNKIAAQEKHIVGRAQYILYRTVDLKAGGDPEENKIKVENRKGAENEAGGGDSSDRDCPGLLTPVS